MKKSEIRILDDVSVIGFDNDPMGIACEPELTTVNQLVPRMATMTFDLLFKNNSERMVEREAEWSGKISFPNSIVQN